jgi:hypothetical protein
MATRLTSRSKPARKRVDDKKSSITKAVASRKKHIAKDFDFKPKTELGKKLWAARKRIVASGEELLDWDGVHREVMSRRSGLQDE